MLSRIVVKTKEQEEIIDITERVAAIVERSKICCGLCVVFVPSDTAAVTLNHHDDEDLFKDLVRKMGDIVPWSDRYLHLAGDSAAHLKSSLIGPSLALIVENGKLVLGSHQGILFAEFNGGKSQKIYVKVMADCDAQPHIHESEE